MSTVKVNTLTGTGTAGSIAVTGEGNSTTTNLQQGLCKSWGHFIGTAGTPAFDDSFNKSSLIDESGDGAWTTVFTNNMANADYVELPVSSAFSGLWSNAEMTTSDCKFFTSTAAGTNTNRDITATANIGDLA